MSNTPATPSGVSSASAGGVSSASAGGVSSASAGGVSSASAGGASSASAGGVSSASAGGASSASAALPVPPVLFDNYAQCHTYLTGLGITLSAGDLTDYYIRYKAKPVEMTPPA